MTVNIYYIKGFQLNPIMKYLFLIVLCRSCCIATETADISMQIAELAKMFREQMIETKDFEQNEASIRCAEINEIIVLSKALEENVNKSHLFWEKLWKKEMLGEVEIQEELIRMTDLICFIEKVLVFFEIDKYLGKEKIICIKTLKDVKKCFFWLDEIFKNLNEEDCGLKRMDFHAVKKTLLYYVDCITFLNLNIVLFSSSG
eukprot:jgi/Antlo1/1908/2391